MINQQGCVPSAHRKIYDNCNSLIKISQIIYNINLIQIVLSHITTSLYATVISSFLLRSLYRTTTFQVERSLNTQDSEVFTKVI